MDRLNVADIQQRYLRDESILSLAESYGVDFEVIHKIVKPLHNKFKIKQIKDMYNMCYTVYEIAEMLSLSTCTIVNVINDKHVPIN